MMNSEQKIHVSLIIKDVEETGGTWGTTETNRTLTLDKTFEEWESWREIMEQLQGLVECYYGYTFSGYGSREEEQ